METDYGRRLGARLRRVREALRLSRDQASARTGGRITPGTLKGLEYGTRNADVDHLALLGAAYGVAPADLVPR
jgi:transcriptional regulator with XRE-family HTH domain